MRKNLKKISSLLALLFLTGVTFADMKASGDVKKGKALFNDPKLGGGKTGKSCNSCHPDGKGLETFIEENENESTGIKSKTPEEAVNMCIKSPMKGAGMDLKGEDMVNVITYLKSLKKPVSVPEKTGDNKSGTTPKKAW